MGERKSGDKCEYFVQEVPLIKVRNINNRSQAETTNQIVSIKIGPQSTNG